MAKKPTGDKTVQIEGKRSAYLIWFLSPDKEPRTRSAWSATNDVSRMTLWEWERSDWFRAAIEKAAPQREAEWQLAYSNLVRIATQQQDSMAAVSAIKEMGKLLRKYPSEKFEVEHVERVAYVKPGALRDMAASVEPKPN